MRKNFLALRRGKCYTNKDVRLKGGIPLKNIGLLVWFTQLGISVAVPLIGAVGISLWLYNRYEVGPWVIFVGVGVGLYGAVDGLRSSLRAMKRLAEQETTEKQDRRNGQDG